MGIIINYPKKDSLYIESAHNLFPVAPFTNMV